MSDDIDRLLDEARRLDDGPARTALCEEAARLADTRHDLDRGFAARLDLIQSASFGGQPDVKLVAFSWVLAQLDRHPERFAQHLRTVLWRYKWVVSEAPSFPELSRERILDLLADMRERHRAFGSTLHAAHHKARGVAHDTGDRAAALEAHALMSQTPRDDLSDCPACCQDALIDFHSFLGEYDAAAAAADPIFKGRMSCATVPERTYGSVLLPLFKLGRVEEAMRHHRRGYPEVAGKPGHLGCVREHVEFMALTANFERAAKIAERHLPAVLAYPTPSMRRDWFTALRLLFALARDAGVSELAIRLPAGHPLKTPDDRVPTAALLECSDQEARRFAAVFDARNGTTRYADAIENQARLMREVKPLPFTRPQSGFRSDEYVQSPRRNRRAD